MNPEMVRLLAILMIWLKFALLQGASFNDSYLELTQMTFPSKCPSPATYRLPEFSDEVIKAPYYEGEVLSNNKKALIFGVTGQDGSYLLEFLLARDYEVHGVARHYFADEYLINFFFENPCFFFHYGDVTDPSHINELIGNICPDEIYNLSAQSNVVLSFQTAEQTTLVNGLGALYILEAIKSLKMEKQVKFFQAGSSELFGLTTECPQNELTPFYPRSPYGIAKLYAFWMTTNYRDRYGIFACNGILYNHESPRRGELFVTRKITRSACLYKLGIKEILQLGNLDAKRDWGYAKDYVEAMWLTLQQDVPRDYVIATGEHHSIREFVELAYGELGITIEWKGSGLGEYGIDKETKEIIIKIDPSLYRNDKGECLLGNNQKIREHLHWSPKTHFRKLVKIMVESDYQQLIDCLNR